MPRQPKISAAAAKSRKPAKARRRSCHDIKAPLAKGTSIAQLAKIARVLAIGGGREDMETFLRDFRDMIRGDERERCAEAVAAERERCAGIVDAEAEEANHFDVWKHADMKILAAAIRQPAKKGSKR